MRCEEKRKKYEEEQHKDCEDEQQRYEVEWRKKNEDEQRWGDDEA